ncbi:MAG TPA: SIMPL domain-containing protein, partial [Acidimicrobiales bacterium]|nr:SIMPL domain-containing protein [Acidimicrobiales bacterium]
SQIESLSYSVADPGPLLAAAHADAVHQAVAEAKAMAAAAGVSLGALRAVSDASSPQVLPYVGAVPAMSGAAPRTAVPVETGTEQVTADVTVTYALG